MVLGKSIFYLLEGDYKGKACTCFKAQDLGFRV